VPDPIFRRFGAANCFYGERRLAKEERRREMERSEERKKIGSDPGGVSAESDVATAKEATAKEAALDEENEAVIKEKAEETARELSAAAAVDINFVADGTPLAENSAQNFEQNGNEPKIGKTEEEIAVKIKYSDVYYDEYIAHFEKNTKKDMAINLLKDYLILQYL
jgi:hypothetical protein